MLGEVADAPHLTAMRDHARGWVATGGRPYRCIVFVTVKTGVFYRRGELTPWWHA
jgi:hypothetical protein